MEQGDIKRCPICLMVVPLESHHVIPIEYGGHKDGKQVDICSTCHQNIHYTAEALSSKKGLTKQWLSDAQLLRAKIFILSIVQAKLDADGNINPNTVRKVLLKPSHKQLVLMHKRKKDLGFTNIPDYVMSLIKRDLSNL